MECTPHSLVCRAILQRLEIPLPRLASLLLSVSALNSYRMFTTWGHFRRPRDSGLPERPAFAGRGRPSGTSLPRADVPT